MVELVDLVRDKSVLVIGPGPLSDSILTTRPDFDTTVWLKPVDVDDPVLDWVDGRVDVAYLPDREARVAARAGGGSRPRNLGRTHVFLRKKAVGPTPWGDIAFAVPKITSVTTDLNWGTNVIDLVAGLQPAKLTLAGVDLYLQPLNYRAGTLSAYRANMDEMSSRRWLDIQTSGSEFLPLSRLSQWLSHDLMSDFQHMQVLGSRVQLDVRGPLGSLLSQTELDFAATYEESLRRGQHRPESR